MPKRTTGHRNCGITDSVAFRSSHNREGATNHVMDHRSGPRELYCGTDVHNGSCMAQVDVVAHIVHKQATYPRVWMNYDGRTEACPLKQFVSGMSESPWAN